MKRRMSRAFSAGILVMALAVAGLFAAQQAQAQRLHYGPGPGDGVEVWATPQTGGYQVEYNAGASNDGDTRYSGFLKIVRTAGGTNYVQGVVVGGGGGDTYTIGPASYFTATEHYYDGSWLHQQNGHRAEHLNLNSDSPAPPPTVSITAPSSGATYTVSYNANGATSGAAPDSQTKTAGVALLLAANSGNLAGTGYTFAGWNTAADGSGTSYAVGGHPR